MVRNLMMMFGLSLAVAAFGCSDDDATNPGGAGGSAGSGGSGGSGGSAPSTAPACDNTDDLAEIASGQPETALSIQCGTLAAGDPTMCDPDAEGMNDCYQDGTDTPPVDGTTLSTECSYCYSELTCCTFVKCSVLANPPSDPPGNCAGPPAPGSECQACIDRECQPAFDTCGEGDPTDPA
jgi:hypothetical protein